MNLRLIYLDHNSTSPLDADVAAKMTESFAAGYVNPASQHRLGQNARRVLEQHRRQIVETLGGCVTGMATDQLVFTSGGTESDNLALFGLASVGRQRLIDSNQIGAEEPVQILISAVEHDALTFTAHKFAGPRGIGGLLLRHGVTPDPMFFGGFQQTAIRPGTEDICLVIGLSAAMDKFVVNVDQYQKRLAGLRNDLQSQLEAALPEVRINSGEVSRTPQTLNLGFVGINRQSFLMSADLAGLAISTGSACASGSSDPSPVLIAMGLDPEIVDSSVRISLGYSTTEADVEQAVAIICQIVQRNRSDSR